VSKGLHCAYNKIIIFNLIFVLKRLRGEKGKKEKKERKGGKVMCA
jgi:hypothetical protein